MNMLGQTAFDASVKLFKSKAFPHTEIRVANDSQAENHFQKKQQSDASPSHYISCETDCNRCLLYTSSRTSTFPTTTWYSSRNRMYQKHEA